MFYISPCSSKCTYRGNTGIILSGYPKENIIKDVIFKFHNYFKFPVILYTLSKLFSLQIEVSVYSLIPFIC